MLLVHSISFITVPSTTAITGCPSRCRFSMWYSCWAQCDGKRNNLNKSWIKDTGRTKIIFSAVFILSIMPFTTILEGISERWLHYHKPIQHTHIQRKSMNFNFSVRFCFSKYSLMWSLVSIAKLCLDPSEQTWIYLMPDKLFLVWSRWDSYLDHPLEIRTNNAMET